MKTKELIKLLQEEDPSGEGHVRFRGYGVPCSCSAVPGYYDGSYDYIENGRFVISKKGYKVDVYTKDLEDFLWEEKNHPRMVKTVGLRKEDEKHIDDYAKKTYKQAQAFHKQLNEEMLERVQDKVKDGYILVQDGSNLKCATCFWAVRRLEDFQFYASGEWREDTDNQKKMVQGEGKVIINSGKFKPNPLDNFTIWEPI